MRTSAARRGVTWVSSGERLDGAAVEDLALDRAALEHAPLGRLELVEARREQRLQGGRDDHLAVRLAGHRHHLLDEERVAARGAGDPLAQLAGDALGDQLLDVVVGQRLEPKRHRPGGRRSTSSGRAMQSSRIGAPEESSATCSIRSRNVSSPHWMSSKTTTSGRSAAACSSVLRKAQAISSDVAASLSPSSERIAAAAASSDGSSVELLQHLDDRPVRDPLAVGEAAAADDRRLDRRQGLGDEPRLADAGLADDRHELAALLGLHALPGLAEERELALASDEPRLVPALGRSRTRSSR